MPLKLRSPNIPPQTQDLPLGRTHSHACELRLPALGNPWKLARETKRRRGQHRGLLHHPPLPKARLHPPPEAPLVATSAQLPGAATAASFQARRCSTAGPPSPVARAAPGKRRLRPHRGLGSSPRKASAGGRLGGSTSVTAPPSLAGRLAAGGGAEPPSSPVSEAPRKTWLAGACWATFAW